MAKVEGSVVLYAVDLDELRGWVGCRDDARVRAALQDVGADPEAGWAGDLRPTFERLLRRVTHDGALYQGLEEADRYYLTQLLIDLFDEYVDAEPLSDELPLNRLLREAESLPPGKSAAGLARLLRGRELNGDGLLWPGGPASQAQPYLGYVTRTEAPPLAADLEQALKTSRARPSGLWKPLVAALRECAETEYDLVSFVG